MRGNNALATCTETVSKLRDSDKLPGVIRRTERFSSLRSYFSSFISLFFIVIKPMSFIYNEAVCLNSRN